MKIRRLVFALFLFLGSTLVYGQTGASLDIQVIDPLPELPIGTFAIGNSIATNQTVFTVSMDVSNVPGLPPNAEVQIYGEFSWKDVGSSNFESMAQFITKPFRPRSFTNNDLGNSDIKILKAQTQSDVIERNIRKGKPVGTYKLIMWLHAPKPGFPVTLNQGNNNVKHPVGTFLAVSNEVIMEIQNPSQTLTINEPMMDAVCDAGNVTASWTSIQGVSSYKIKANYKRYLSQSLDDALRSGEPIIDNADVGLQTSVNLRTLLNREWIPGKQVVFQVTAIINGVGQSTIYSQPVSFTIRPQMSAALQNVMNNLSTVMQSFASAIPPAILNQMVTGNLVVNEIRLGDGTILSEAQVQQIVTYLQSHPNDILNITFVTP